MLDLCHACFLHEILHLQWRNASSAAGCEMRGSVDGIDDRVRFSDFIQEGGGNTQGTGARAPGAASFAHSGQMPWLNSAPRMLPDVDFEPAPGALLVPDLVAIGADRQQAVQDLDAGKGRLQLADEPLPLRRRIAYGLEQRSDQCDPDEHHDGCARAPAPRSPVPTGKMSLPRRSWGERPRAEPSSARSHGRCRSSARRFPVTLDQPQGHDGGGGLQADGWRGLTRAGRLALSVISRFSFHARSEYALTLRRSRTVEQAATRLLAFQHDGN